MTREPIYLTWLNNPGGFEYFWFTGKNLYTVEIEETGTTQNNLLPPWPKSYGSTADTITRQTFRKARNTITIRSQNITRNQLEGLIGIRTSVVVQHVISRNNRRTMIVDADSFKKYDELENLFTLQFTLTYTDEIPSQRI